MGAGVLIADRYRLDEPLARGGMGAVWRALDTTLQRPVAVKLLALDGDAALIERFRLEARAAARLNHPNLVAAYDFGSHEGRPYLVMELVEGRSLSEELAALGPLEPGRAADIAAGTARGLAAAHRQSVVHRDIKPGNLMLGTDGTVKITDFGIARLIDEISPALTATGHVMGSGDYLAPERALGAPTGPAADVYSLGCVLYEMLTGQPPFRGRTAAAVAHSHVADEAVPPEVLRPGLPAPLVALVPRMLAKAPEIRPTADQVADWLGDPDGSASALAPLPAVEAGPLPAAPAGPPPAAPRVAAAGHRQEDTALMPLPGPPPPHPPNAPARGGFSPRSRIALAAVCCAVFAAALVVGATTGFGAHHAPSAPNPGSSAPGRVAADTTAPLTTAPLTTAPETIAPPTAKGRPAAPPPRPPAHHGPGGKDGGGRARGHK